MSNEDIGARLKSVRIERGYTLDEVALAVGVAKSTIQRYEAGKITSIKLPVIESIARFLRVNPAWVIGKSQTPDISYVSNDANYIIELHPKDNDYYNALIFRLSQYQKCQSFLSDYLQLNEAGQAKLHEQLQLLSKIPEYQAETESTPVPDMLNAAHADTGASPEDKKHDDDIMNDDTKWGN